MESIQDSLAQCSIVSHCFVSNKHTGEPGCREVARDTMIEVEHMSGEKTMIAQSDAEDSVLALLDEAFARVARMEQALREMGHCNACSLAHRKGVVECATVNTNVERRNQS